MGHDVKTFAHTRRPNGLLLAALAFCHFAVAADPPAASQDAPSSAAQGSPSQTPPAELQYTMPEIRILANHDTQHLSAMTKDIVKAEQDFSDAWNKVNDVRVYDVHCNWEAPTGSRFRYFICKPVFQEEAERNGSVGIIPGQSGDTSVYVGEDKAPLAQMRAAYQKHMVDLVGKHPELIEKLQEHSALIKKYEDVQKQKHANGKFFVWD